MHACGGGPRQGGAYLCYDLKKEFSDIGIPAVRLHDIEGAYGNMQFVDVHNIFPDFSADPNDHLSYNFGPTDDYLRAIKESGAKIIYRLGSSIEHYKRKLFIFPPKDYVKWADICEHIIRHYNGGWCNGFYWEIEHWEIWNEPESAGMWQGTPRQFYEFYSVVANYLKNCYPKLKIGGYSAVGFYTETRPGVDNPWFRTIVPFFEGFMSYITAKETTAPLDFFSWHCYAERPEEVSAAAKYVRSRLDDYGFIHTESYLTEYNTYESLNTCPQVIPGYAAELAAGMICAQNSSMDMMMYYDLRPHSMNGIWKIGKDYRSADRLHGFYAMKAFGYLYRLGTQVYSESDAPVYLLAAADAVNKGIMLSVRSFTGEVIVNMEGIGGTQFFEVKESSFRRPAFHKVPAVWKEGTLRFNVHENCIYYIKNVD